jgi:hypothetical protein
MKELLCVKKITSLFTTLLILFSFGSCKANSISYSDVLTCSELFDKVIVSFDSENCYATADSLYLNDYFEIPSYVTDSVIRFSSDTGNLNEIGIFHTTEGNTRQMADLLKLYLLESYKRNHTWYDSYIPAETPKLRDAEIRIYGNYVVYAILSKESQNHLFQLLDQQLRRL